MRIRFYAMILLLLILYSNDSIATITCPLMPTSVTDVNRDIKSDINASAASLWKVKAGEVSTKTEITAKNLFEKYPNIDKLITLQTMAATYCTMLRDTKTVSEKEKLDRWERFQEKVLSLQSSPTQEKQPQAKPNSVTLTQTNKDSTKRAPTPKPVEKQFDSDKVEGNKYVIQGDYIEGNKKITNLTEEDIKIIVKETLKAQENDRAAKYPFGHIGFGISKNKFIVPKGDIPPEVKIDWSSGKILNVTDQLVDFILPNMTIKNVQFWSTRIILKKKIGAMIKPQRVDNISTIAEVIGIDHKNDLLIIGVGFVNVTS